MKKVFFSILAAGLCIGASAQVLRFHTTFTGNANDASGLGHNGTISGTPTWVPGVAGVANTAMHFSGDDLVTIAAHSDFNLTTWTLQAFIRPTALANTLCQVNSIIWHGLQFQQRHYSLRICDNWYDLNCNTNSASDAFDAQGPGTSATPDFQSPWYTTNGFATPGRWYCLTATFGPNAVGTPTVTVYVDGTVVETGPWAGGAYNYTQTDPTYIGWSPHVGWPYWFEGDMDQVSIWSGVMGPVDILKYCDATRANTWKQSNPNGTAEAIESVNILAIANDKIEISPVPATDAIKVNVSEHWKGGQMVIMNGVGQVLMEQTIEGTLHDIDISEFPIGIYIMKVTKGNEIKVEKFIKD